MYPFNRASSLAVDEHLPTTNGSAQQGRQKTIFNSILDMSAIPDQWVENLERRRHTSTGCSWRGVTFVSRCLKPVLLFMKIIALFPGTSSTRLRRRRTRKRIHFAILFYFSLLAVMLNAYLIVKNISLIQAYKERFGLMHAATVSNLTTGIKPLINAFVIAIFSLRIRQHLRLLKTIDQVDVCFRSAFRISPPIHRYRITFFFLAFVAFAVPFTFRVVEFVITEQSIGTDILQDTAFITVPMLTLWNIVPLLYYDMYNRIVRFYCRVLIKSLNKERRYRHFSLKFYYEQFMRITSVQEAVGNLFNPFLLFTLAWSVLVLCLAIYFITQPHSSLLEPISPEQVTNERFRHLLTRRVHFTMGWAGLQVLVALVLISGICWAGMATNEITRQIVNAVLRIVPDANADLDRFQISCFVHKMTTQFMWGMTVWRVFPLERTTFFTLVSVIVTYAFLLLKLKENPAVMPITRSIIIQGLSNFTTPLPR